jgi:RimJ/RimL family protein N-acetyltransferase
MMGGTAPGPWHSIVPMQAADPIHAQDFDSQPVLRGPTLLLRPLVQSDYEPLWEAARDPLIWEQHPDKTRATPEGFAHFFHGALESRSALVVIDHRTGRIVGSSRYYDWEPHKRELAIGYTFLAREYWGGEANREMKRLMIEHAARWAGRIWFHVGANNMRSRRAMEKLGAHVVFERPRPLNGVMVDFLYYALDTAPYLA